MDACVAEYASDRMESTLLTAKAEQRNENKGIPSHREADFPHPHTPILYIHPHLSQLQPTPTPTELKSPAPKPQPKLPSPDPQRLSENSQRQKK